MVRRSSVPEGFPTATPTPVQRDGPRSPPDDHALGERLRKMTEEELRRAGEDWARTSGMGAHDGG
jgi:hypothetical protein